MRYWIAWNLDLVKDNNLLEDDRPGRAALYQYAIRTGLLDVSEAASEWPSGYELDSLIFAVRDLIGLGPVPLLADVGFGYGSNAGSDVSGQIADSVLQFVGEYAEAHLETTPWISYPGYLLGEPLIFDPDC